MKKERNKQRNREDSFKIFLISKLRRSNLFQPGELRFFFSILVAISISFTLFFLMDIETESYDQKHPRSETDFVRLVFAEEINGTENADNLTGTINQDTIKGLGGNDTLYGREAGDDISGGRNGAVQGGVGGQRRRHIGRAAAGRADLEQIVQGRHLRQDAGIG